MSEFLFWLAITNLAMCIAVGVPLFFGIRRIRRLEDVPPLSDTSSPKVSLVIPARNEESDIEVALQSLLRLDYESLQIVAVNDRSTDRTGELLDKVAEKDSRFSVVHLDALPPGWLGKNFAMYRGAQAADGELLLFADADVVMQPSVLSRAVGYLRTHQIDHLPLFFQIKMPNWLLESFAINFAVYLLTYLRPWKCPDPNSTAHIGVGAFNLIRADVYRQIGTHEAIRMRPDDDIKLGKLVKKHRFRQELLNAAGLIYVPWYSSVRELVLGMEKNAFSGSDYRIWFTTLFIVSMLLFNVFPFVAVFITRGATQWLYIGVIICLLLIGFCAAYHMKARWSCCLGFPLAALLMSFIATRTMIVNLASGGIRWRDTHYPLHELKANRV